MRPLAFHWHRLAEWLFMRLAERAFARGRHHHVLALAHGAEADRICPPAGPNGRPPQEDAPPEWGQRLSARSSRTDSSVPPRT